MFGCWEKFVWWVGGGWHSRIESLQVLLTLDFRLGLGLWQYYFIICTHHPVCWSLCAATENPNKLFSSPSYTTALLLSRLNPVTKLQVRWSRVRKVLMIVMIYHWVTVNLINTMQLIFTSLTSQSWTELSCCCRSTLLPEKADWSKLTHTWCTGGISLFLPSLSTQFQVF